jgi:hypothetical protein
MLKNNLRPEHKVLQIKITIAHCDFKLVQVHFHSQSILSFCFEKVLSRLSLIFVFQVQCQKLIHTAIVEHPKVSLL